MFTLGPHELIVGLGSSDDNAPEMLRRARGILRAHPDFKLLASSSFYESDALTPPDAPAHWHRTYFNGACLLEYRGSELNAALLMSTLKNIERQMGRVDAARWAPRIIDLDLLAWGGPDVREATVTIPHPGLWDRPFALLPAHDCAGSRYGGATHPWRYAHSDDVPLNTRVSATTWSQLVGIVNITPDSFSDGRLQHTATALEEQVRRLAAEGATVIDLGAESTRPGATAVSAAEEQKRLAPALDLLGRLKGELGFRLSLDSRHSATVRWALERFPVDWINDVEGFSDPQMVAAAAKSGCHVVVMHSLGVPPLRHVTIPTDRDPVQEIMAWGQRKILALVQGGIPHQRIIFDPGVGFGKTPSQNLALIRRSQELHALKVPLLLGHSRKGFLDPQGVIAAADRDLETAILTATMAASGVDYIRVHAIPSQRRALALGSRMP